MEGHANAYRAVVTNGVSHLEGPEGTCKDLREKGCEEENTGLLQ